MSGASEHGQRDGRDQELERLRRLVRDLEGIETTEKGGMIAWGIEAKRALASPVPFDFGTGRSPKNHTDTGTTHILEKRVNTETVHVHMDMTTMVRVP